MSSIAPVGTILASLLDYDRFIKALSQHGQLSTQPTPPPPPVNPGTTEWVPADGRAVNGSAYHRLTGQTNVPDLRGLFLRGLNNFDANWTAQPVNPGQLDPAGMRIPGSYQPDGIGQHAHGFSYREPGGQGGSVSGGREGLVETQRSTSPAGGSETVSKNAAVAYYICIN